MKDLQSDRYIQFPSPHTNYMTVARYHILCGAIDTCDKPVLHVSEAIRSRSQPTRNKEKGKAESGFMSSETAFYSKDFPFRAEVEEFVKYHGINNKVLQKFTDIRGFGAGSFSWGGFACIPKWLVMIADSIWRGDRTIIHHVGISRRASIGGLLFRSD